MRFIGALLRAHFFLKIKYAGRWLGWVHRHLKKSNLSKNCICLPLNKFYQPAARKEDFGSVH
jgi:hypothetical protein